MDLDILKEMINEPRAVNIRITTNSGKTLELPPGAKAYEHGVDTLLLLWPTPDPSDPFKVPRSFYLSGVNVSTAERLTTPAA